MIIPFVPKNSEPIEEHVEDNVVVIEETTVIDLTKITEIVSIAACIAVSIFAVAVLISIIL